MISNLEDKNEEVLNNSNNIEFVQPYVEPVNNDNSNSEFIFDDDDDYIENNELLEEETQIEESHNEEEISVEPLPIMQGNGVVDPVFYYDTLDPGFFEKIKESAGLDLKTAINSYRDLTTLLGQKGFKISIDEADVDKTYRIQIDINKE